MMVELVVITRLMFFLPAQSVGVTLSVPDALRASKGGTVPMILSTILMSLCLGLAITVYMVILFSVLGFAFGDVSIPQPMVAITAMILAMPIYAAIFVFMAMEVTALSKLYQHGMENNA
jgi:hypothetical protein